MIETRPATAAPTPVAPGLEDVPRRSAAPPAIEVRGVSHRYQARVGEVLALEGIDLSVRRGELLAVIGPSGCGKSTLLRILAGLLEPTRGSALLDGDPPSAAVRRRAIGWLAQDDGLLPWRNVFGNVALPFVLGRRGQVNDGAVWSMLERVGLAESAARYPHELSGGMRQRAALARALVSRPAFLLLDEPFAHLDEITRERLGDLLRTLQDELAPTTVLLTHSVAEAVRLADRVVVLTAGPGRVRMDVEVPLEHPRTEDQPGFGFLVHQLKSGLDG